MHNTDLNIFYSGGSGGFYFLHCLLMQGTHFAWFPKLAEHTSHPDLRLLESSYNNIKDSSWPDYEWYFKNGNNGQNELIAAESQWAYNPEVVPGWFNKQFDLVHTRQWNVNTDQWKSTEIWPVNNNTLISNCIDRDYKIFFTCGDVDQWLTFPGKKIVLFTDITTQLRMSMYKKAWLYQTTPATFSSVKKILKTSKEYKEFRVSNPTANALAHAEQSIYLQDFVKVMLNSTVEQQTFTKHWLSNHPVALLNKCNLG